MFYDDYPPPHIHVFYQNNAAKFDFLGNIIDGNLKSPTATRLLRERIDMHNKELEKNWELARIGRPLEKIPPLV